MIERQETDILIIGAGGAGLFAALHAQASAPEGTSESRGTRENYWRRGNTTGEFDNFESPVALLTNFFLSESVNRISLSMVKN